MVGAIRYGRSLRVGARRSATYLLEACERRGVEEDQRIRHGAVESGAEGRKLRAAWGVEDLHRHIEIAHPQLESAKAHRDRVPLWELGGEHLHGRAESDVAARTCWPNSLVNEAGFQITRATGSWWGGHLVEL